MKIVAANVLIHEEGRLQLCDFGVATVLDKKTDKRRTFIGTLHWMPPELWDRDPEYSDEVSTIPLWAIWNTINDANFAMRWMCGRLAARFMSALWANLQILTCENHTSCEVECDG
jgi:serine/threonine protein kinase